MARPLRDRIHAAYDQHTLKRVCEMRETSFARFGEVVTVTNTAHDNFYVFQDNGADILAVAHLDTVAAHSTRAARFVQTEAGPVVFSRALDDRLGAYVILDMLPKLGIKTDILLTTGEEMGQSTAQHFVAPRTYNWIIEFDRGGTDVVLYQYQNAELSALVRESGASVGHGSFSDISYLDHLGVKALNWGVGYAGNYHGPRAHAYLNDTFDMVAKFCRFYQKNADLAMPHTVPKYGKRRSNDWSEWGDGYSHGGGWHGNRGKGRSYGESDLDLSYAWTKNPTTGVWSQGSSREDQEPEQGIDDPVTVQQLEELYADEYAALPDVVKPDFKAPPPY